MSYEVEIKSLLGAPEKAAELKKRLAAFCPDLRRVSHHKQLNHYFDGGDMQKLEKSLASYLDDAAKEKLADIIKRGENFSVRTREADGKVLIVVKASIDEGTSHNTVSRLEFEAPVCVRDSRTDRPVALSLDELDELILAADFSYQAKWSREREEYRTGDMNVCLDKNAGYGYLAEFEKVVENDSDIESVRNELRTFMNKLGVEELPQDRLERMFAHYNENWPDYYGTDKVFVIE